MGVLLQLRSEDTNSQSDADMNDLEFGAKMGYDFIAASFVRSAADINYLRRFTESLGWFNVRIIAKIENIEGVKNFEDILKVANGIMVARGDLGVVGDVGNRRERSAATG